MDGNATQSDLPIQETGRANLLMVIHTQANRLRLRLVGQPDIITILRTGEQ